MVVSKQPVCTNNPCEWRTVCRRALHRGAAYLLEWRRNPYRSHSVTYLASFHVQINSQDWTTQITVIDTGTMWSTHVPYSYVFMYYHGSPTIWTGPGLYRKTSLSKRYLFLNGRTTSTTPSCSELIPAQKSSANSVPGTVFSHRVLELNF